MRWSCPHCRTPLAIKDDQTEGGWSFMRCYQCGGFSLVRKSDQRSMKVNRPPAQAQVHLPTGPENLLLSKSAQSHLDQIKDASRKAESLQEIAKSLKSINPSMEASGEIFSQVQGERATSSRKISQSRWLPVAIGAAAAMALFSGTFLLIEGHALWNQARNSKSQQSHHNDSDDRNKILQGISTFKKEETSAQLHDEINEASSAPQKPAILDEGHSKEGNPNAAMKERRSKVVYRTQKIYQPITLRSRVSAVNLRSGPGLDYSVEKTIHSHEPLVLKDWENNWFKVSLKSHPQINYWIRNDLIQFNSIK